MAATTDHLSIAENKCKRYEFMRGGHLAEWNRDIVQLLIESDLKIYTKT